MVEQSTATLLMRLWRHITPRRRWQFGLLLVLMLLASFAEVVSIGAVMPFLGVLTAPERIFQMQSFQPVISALNLTQPKQLILPVSLAFGFAALFVGSMRLLMLWANTRLSFATGSDLSVNIYRRTLYQPYKVHCARNSSEVINGISSKTGDVIGIIGAILSFTSSVLILITILIALLMVNPTIAIAAFGGFGLIYAAIICLTKSRLLTNGQIIARESSHVIKSLQEGLGGIRDVLIDGNQAAYCQIYLNADLPQRRAQANSNFIGASPRYAMEALGIILITVLAYSLAQQEDGITKAIPVLGALAIGAQRFLPALQQAYSAWSGILASQASLQDTLELLEQPLPDFAYQPAVKLIPFKRTISLNQVSFRYTQQTSYVLKNINLTITKGSRVGFIGVTGSGKSTLLDIIMGLLQATEGTLEIDGQAVTHANNRGWQAHIAHVPQIIFLADSSIEENIAFGIAKDEIDRDRVRQAAQQAQIAESIESWPMQYQTFVGERGVRLSGGQRQRIGIARALYKRADVIIFDEATSSLDNETEQAIMQAIDGLSKEHTILIIAHRLTTLKNCTQLLKLGESGVVSVGSYQDIVNESAIKK
jgi:ABC-type bacteriocin/lantibiotic exporter with double-glycine peptidase domain